ncbi:MAG: hypothetical protein P4L33_11530 [Capsulimonadaceae bacterium]|nr:hypothetical protein [Capsulimonadaceae bacterium]
MLKSSRIARSASLLLQLSTLILLAFSAAAWADPSDSNVFNYRDIPSGEQVTIVHPTFDQGGYQLPDTSGETIIVPFASDNLYVMKFARATGPDFYFVNDNGTPILYVPRRGYLENAAVPGAFWYPFARHEYPSEPVVRAIAPTWSAFIGIGWYPGMHYYAGFAPGGRHVDGFRVVIGSSVFLSWGPFSIYYHSHPAPYHMMVVHPDFYRWGGAPRFHGDHRVGFAGDRHGFIGDHRGFVGDHRGFVGGHGAPVGDHRGFVGDHGAPAGGHGGFVGDHGAPAGGHGGFVGDHGAPAGGHGGSVGDHGAPAGGHGGSVGGHDDHGGH